VLALRLYRRIGIKGLASSKGSMGSMMLPLLGAVPYVFAQTTSFSSAAASSTGTATTSSAFTHTIGVAEGGFTFVPNVVLADVGDYIGS
jgi:hypothetical protein